MRLVTPEVYFVGVTAVDRAEMYRYLVNIGAPEWRSDTEDDAAFLAEVMGRLCYASFGTGINPNVTKVREGNEVYIANLLTQLHGSVLEHVQFNFIFRNVSRVFTHELVRHRVGVAISQQSMRYVRKENIPMWLPDEFLTDPEVLSRAKDFVQHAEEFQAWLTVHFGLDNQSVGFHIKKRITSAMRRFLLIGIATEIGWSCNVRTLRHVIETRTSPGAEVEIRLVFGFVARMMMERYPMFFGDFESIEDEQPEHPAVRTYKPKYRKV